jgi:hypothetical protein
MKVENKDKTAFITPHGVYCYMTMPFGLKNAGATYQWCMQACLKEQIGRNVKVYIDDIVIKTVKADILLDDLRETFANLDRYNIKLNPKKCSFGVPTGQLLGYLISKKGIEGNPEEIQAIINMQPPRTLRHVQQLMGRLAALSRFISKLGEKALPFYRLLQKMDNFTWTEEAQNAFDDLKRRLSTSPVLVTPRKKEPMLLYIAATNQVVSSVLVVERAEDGKEHGVQRPVYYLSEVLSLTKQRYPNYQKLAYAKYMMGKKLPHYFECHSIIVVASNPVSSILNNPDATGRVSLWGITLGPWEITYQRQSAIKSQVLPDFIAEWTEAQMPELPVLANCWTIFVDGSKRVSGAGAGVVLVSPQGDKMRYVLCMRFMNPSNNEAEYEAVLHGMRMAKACGATRIKIHGDLNLIA